MDKELKSLDLDALLPEVVVRYKGQEHKVKYLTPAEELRIQVLGKKLDYAIKQRDAVNAKIDALGEDDSDQFEALLAESEEWSRRIAKIFNEITSISIPTMKDSIENMPSVQMVAMSNFIQRTMGSAGEVPPQSEDS